MCFAKAMVRVETEKQCWRQRVWREGPGGEDAVQVLEVPKGGDNTGAVTLR